MTVFSDSKILLEVEASPDKGGKRRRVALSVDHVTDKLRRRIIEGGLPRGSMFSSRRSLAVEFGVSLGTVQQAVTALISEGYLETRGNTGTVVSLPSSRGMKVESFRIAQTARGYVGIVTREAQTSDGPEANGRHIITNAIEREAANLGHPTIVQNIWRDFGERISFEEGINCAVAAGAETIVVVFPDDTPETEAIGCRGAWSSQPIVFVSSHPMRLPVIHCYYDTVADGYRAAQLLVESGCRNLLFVSPSSDWWVDSRLSGIKALLGHNVDLEIQFTATVADALGKWREHEDYTRATAAMASEILGSGQRFDGVIAANDQCAYGWVDTAESFGIYSGKDYAIIGFDDREKSQRYGLTTLRPPLEAMGVQAARLAVAALRREECPSHVCLRSHLVTRSSTHFNRETVRN